MKIVSGYLKLSDELFFVSVSDGWIFSAYETHSGNLLHNSRWWAKYIAFDSDALDIPEFLRSRK